MTSPNTSHSHDTSQGRRHRRSASSAHHGPRPEWQESKSKEPARRGRRRFGLLLTAVALGVFVWFLPVLVTHTGLLNWIVARATGDLKGSATVKSASLGWFSPVRVSGIQVRDTQGNVVVDVPELAGDTPLAKLALNWKRPGTFTLTQPTVRVVLRGDGSNVEDLIANYLTGPSGEPVAVGLNVIDATIQVQDASGGTPWTIEKFNLALATSNQKDGPMTLAASGLMPEGATAGKFDVKLATGPESRAQLQAEGLPMGRLAALAARFSPGVQMAGRLDAAAAARWGGAEGGADASAVLVAAQLTCRDFDLACPQLGTDRLHLGLVRADGQGAVAQDKLLMDRFTLETDLGGAALLGRLELSTGDPATMLEAILRQTFELRGEVDLARAAAMLPGTLHVDPQTTITRGRLRLDLASRPTDAGPACQGKMEASDLSAVYRGKPVVWEQPLVVELHARKTAAGVVVDRLDCQSTFLTLQGSGNREKMTADGKFDLDQLARQLAGFVDLGGTQLAGKGTVKLDWQHDAQGTFRADANLDVGDLRLIVPGRQPWQESTLTASFWAAGATDFASATRVDSAQLEIKTTSDGLTARLAGPIAKLTADGPWPLAVNMNGDLARWTARARAWNLLSGWDAAGTYRVTANLVASASGVELRDSQWLFDGLRVTGGRLYLNEPKSSLALAGQYDVAGRRLVIRQTKLESSALAVDAPEFVVSMPADGPVAMSGTVSYHGDMARLQGWLTAPGKPPTLRAYGRLQGQAQVSHAAGVVSGRLDATVTKLVMQNADGRQFQDPEAKLTARGSYQSSTDQLKLDEMLLATTALGVRAAGQVDSLSANPKVNLTGRLGYDWQRLTPLLQSYAGDQIIFAGRGDRPMTFAGPLDPAVAQAAAAVDWTGAYVYGFQFGPGVLDARLAGGVVECAPLDLSVSEGRLSARPRLRLSPEPMLLEVEPGRLIQQVRINPNMCAQGLQYIAPVLAGVATAEGRFSIDLDQCRIRLDDPAQSELSGRFTVHTIEIGPGALVRELAVVLNRATAAKLQRESVIRFHLAKGRVYHEGLELVFPEMTVRTYGSVGVTDQTMSLVAEMPIPPKWLAGNQVLDSALKNQVLKVPIRGTLGKPAIDHRTLDQYNKSLLRNATKNVIEGELNRQLDRLFQPPKR